MFDQARLKYYVKVLGEAAGPSFAEFEEACQHESNGTELAKRVLEWIQTMDPQFRVLRHELGTADACHYEPMLLVACFAIATAQRFQVFDTTVSPSKRWAVAYRDPVKGEPAMVPDDEPTINELVDLKRNRVVAKLKNFHGFPHENHSGMFVRYSADESVVAVHRMGKWQPRAILIMSTKSGAQSPVLARIQGDADRYFHRRHSISKGRQYVYDVPGAVFEGRKIKFAVLGQVPKQDVPELDAIITYSYRVSKFAITLGMPTFQLLREVPKWGWAGQ